MPTKTFATERLMLGLALWASETTDPNAGAGTPAALGSFGQQADAYPLTPTTLYLKSQTPDTGWLRQNLVNLNVYNVKDPTYGAVGDGVTDDGPAIQAAVNAANAAGGGIVYFPPVDVVGGEFYRLRKPAVNLGSIMLDNVHNVTFMGDGYASKVEMFDDALGAAWNAFQLHNGTSWIRFENFQISGEGITNGGANGQHLLCIAGFAADANTGTGHVDVVGMFWGANVSAFGNRVTAGGDDAAHSVEYIRYSYNLGDYATGLRHFWAGTLAAGNGGAGFVNQIEATHNWLGGYRTNISGNAIRINIPAASPSKTFTVIGNIANGNVAPSAGSPGACLTSDRGSVAWNVISNGGSITGSRSVRIRGNVVTTGTASSTAVYSLLNMAENGALIAGNVGTREVVSNTAGIDFTSTTVGVSVTDNVVQSSQTSASLPAIDVNSVVGGVTDGNIALLTNNNANNGRGIQSNAVGPNNTLMVGNLILGLGANVMAAGLYVVASGGTQGNLELANNLISRAGIGIDINTSGGWIGWRLLNNNNINGETTTIRLPVTGVGITHEGPGGPGSQMDESSQTPVGLVAAPSGSVASNTTGAQATTLFVKESGTGVSGGTALWLGIGAYDLVSGALLGSVNTAARFFAPGGLGLAVETTVELQIAITRPGTVRNYRLQCTAGTGGGTNTYVIRKNGVNTTVTIAPLNTATNAADTTHSFTVVAGDLISHQVTKSSGAGTPQSNIKLAFEITS